MSILSIGVESHFLVRQIQRKSQAQHQQAIVADPFDNESELIGSFLQTTINVHTGDRGDNSISCHTFS